MGGEVSDDIGSVSSPQGEESFASVCPAEGVYHAFVGPVEAALFDLVRPAIISWNMEVEKSRSMTYHLILVLHHELDALYGGSTGF